jgi:hypothetical protein
LFLIDEDISYIFFFIKITTLFFKPGGKIFPETCSWMKVSYDTFKLALQQNSGRVGRFSTTCRLRLRQWVVVALQSAAAVGFTYY